jgi:hypothetical protein
VTSADAVLAAHTVLAHGVALAKAKANDNEVTPGVLGFLVVAGMGGALYFLLKSMNRQLRKIPPPPPDPEDGEPGEAKPLSPLKEAARRRAAAAQAAQESAAGPAGDGPDGGPDLTDRLGQSPPAQRR